MNNRIFQRVPMRLRTLIGHGLLSFTLILSGAAMANPDDTTGAEANGTDVFEQHGLSPDLPKMGLNSLSTSEHIVEQVTRRLTTEKGVQESQVFLVQTTDTKGNIDLRIKYDPSQIDKHEDLIGRIESLTRSQYRLKQYAENYDKSSLFIDDHGNGNLSISFNYSKYGLPQDIAYFRFIRANIEVVNGEVQTMTLSNTSPFQLEGYQVDDYRQTLTFTTLSNGRVLIKSKHLEVTGSEKGKPVTLVMDITPIAVYDDQLGSVVLDEFLLAQVSDPRIREAQVKVNSVFPLMGDMVRRKGIDIPLPFGVSMAYRNQSMDVGFNDFNIMGANLNRFFDPSTSFGEVSAESFTLRGDVNILPFWNVYGLVGKVKVDANVDAQYTGAMEDVFEEKLGAIGGRLACNAVAGMGLDVCSPTRVQVPLHLNYSVVGIGTTLSVGYKQFFASVNGTFSKTKLEGSDNWGDGIVTVQPMVGYQFADARAQVFVGAEYQGLDSRMTGNLGYVDALGRDFTYDVGVELENWAYLIGFNKQFGKHYNLTGMYIAGDTRDSFTLNLGYRF
ncbi:porin family protein [Ferrimonas balearica]|uniref:porin family protein n=1 Tax=Ferrimonas balearica TaxID=44012 RepID=UPI001F2C3672|nr:porin family protein [Ferrimonas balearica]MBY6095530.1 porin family protein [Ferrimonas balearica]